MDAEPVRGAIIESLLNAHVGTAALGCPTEQSSVPPAEATEASRHPRARRPSHPRSGATPAPPICPLVGKEELDHNRNEARRKILESREPRAGSPGIRFHYDGLEGQKTGAFLDQRDNYAAAAHYAHGDALDVFCYQGGFALHLAPKCNSVIGVDSSRPALEVADQNAALNNREIEWIEANAFDLLRDYAHAGKKYDTIILDPPAFGKTKRDLDKALSGYKELNLRALKMLKPGGILVTCSCSFHVSATDFQQTVASAAQDAHKTLRLLETRGASKDHPSIPNIPETSYLKCLIFNVSN